MGFIQEIVKSILALILLAGVTIMLAEPVYAADEPSFNVFGNAMRNNPAPNADGNDNYYMCDEISSSEIRIVADNVAAQNIGNVNVEVYKNASDVGNISKAVRVYNNWFLEDISYTVNRSDVNPDNKPVVTQTYYFKISPADGSAGSWVYDITYEVRHVDEADIPEFEPYCKSEATLKLNKFISKYTNSNDYSWYETDGTPITGIGGMLSILNLSEGQHNKIVKARSGKCKSLGTIVTFPVKGNGDVRLNTFSTTYTTEDISNGSYSRSVYDQVLHTNNGKELVDNPNDCKHIWKDENGNIINDFEHYTPELTTQYGSKLTHYTVTKDCGCGSVSDPASFTIVRFLMPNPKVQDLEFCINDPQAANGFDASIEFIGDVTEKPTDYILEFSENADMSNKKTLSAGETHFDYAFDVSTASEKTFYIRKEKFYVAENNIRQHLDYSEIVPFKVIVRSPEAPMLTDQKVCANDVQSVALSTISNESGLIWKDANDTPISGSVAIEKRGDIIVSAQRIETINGMECTSKIATAKIHVDSLGVSIDDANSVSVLLPGQTGKAELDIKGSGNQTISWSDASNSIVGNSNSADVNVLMGTSDIILNATVTDGECSQSKNWTIQADLFQCPRPSADDINFCLNDPRAADGFDANIGLENNSDNKSNYKLSVSKNPDMSDATSLSAGETHFNYTFDASNIGDQKIYIQQTEISRNLSSAIVSVNINVSQPTEPSAYSAAICLNDETEIKLSELSSASNLQWLDENKNEIFTTAKFKKRGTHPLYVKRYELVNGEKCWSELTAVSVTTDSIGITVDGDHHLCPGSEGEVTITSVIPSFVQIQWESDQPFTINNTSSPTVNVKMGDSDLNLKYTVTSGVCSTTGAWGITVGSGKVSGKIQFTEGDKVRNSNNLSNVEFSSCGGKVTVEATIEHTSPGFSVKKGNADLGTFTFDGDPDKNIAKFEIEGAGTYTVSYENDCETSFTFNVTEMKIKPTITTTKWSSCYGGYIAAEIHDVDGCKVVWKKDGTVIAKETNMMRVSNVSANDITDYTYELVCDGCPADGIVSAIKPDIYSPLTVTVSQSADTICQKDEVEVEITISPNSDKVKFNWSKENDMTISNDGASVTLAPYHSKSYNVVISNGDCEQQMKTVDVNVHTQMNGNIEAGSIMCEGDSTEIDASSLEAERYEWNHTDSESPIITVVPEGVENKYTVTAYRGKCVLEKEFTLMVGATPKLASVDSIGLDDVEIKMETEGEYKYIVDGKENATDISYNVKNHVGFGKHTLTIIDIAGCKTDTSFVVTTPAFEIQDFIKPGADGKDATFRIPDAVVVYSNTTMNIYDRWGKKLATLTSADEEGWDGTYNGKPMPSADYWYELSVDVIDKTYFGHFTLIRE